jgi:hypothetical protein
VDSAEEMEVDDGEEVVGGEPEAVGDAEADTSSAPSVDEELVAPAPDGALRVPVEIDEDGSGAAFVGLDVDRCSLWNPPPDCSVGIVAAHTIGISRVLVSGATPGSTVNVIVLPK